MSPTTPETESSDHFASIEGLRLDDAAPSYGLHGLANRDHAVDPNWSRGPIRGLMESLKDLGRAWGDFRVLWLGGSPVPHYLSMNGRRGSGKKSGQVYWGSVDGFKLLAMQEKWLTSDYKKYYQQGDGEWFVTICLTSGIDFKSAVALRSAIIRHMQFANLDGSESLNDQFKESLRQRWDWGLVQQLAFEIIQGDAPAPVIEYGPDTRPPKHSKNLLSAINKKSVDESRGSASSSAQISVPNLANEPDYIPLTDIENETLIGTGGFGKVFRSNWNGTQVAVKEMPATERGMQEFTQEASILSKLRHPNVVQYFGLNISQERMRCSLVMELMVKGTLKDLLANNEQQLPWSLRLQIALDVVSGLVYLHGREILHRDIKSDNILLDGNLRAKLTDFGLTRFKDGVAADTQHQQAGTISWMAPELFEEEPYTEKADIFSFGVVLWELASRLLPHSDATSKKQIMLRIMQGKRDETPADCPSDFASVIDKCCEQDPETRPDSRGTMSLLTALQRNSLFKECQSSAQTQDSDVLNTADFSGKI